MYSEIYVSRRKRGMNSMLRAGDAGAYWPDDVQGLHESTMKKLSERTLRDEFAMAALAVLSDKAYQSSWYPNDIAGEAYAIADAMMEAR